MRLRGGRAPHGARGLKFVKADTNICYEGRAPHGARGLKYRHQMQELKKDLSRPAWGAWIEIL